MEKWEIEDVIEVMIVAFDGVFFGNFMTGFPFGLDHIVAVFCGPFLDSILMVAAAAATPGKFEGRLPLEIATCQIAGSGNSEDLGRFPNMCGLSYLETEEKKDNVRNLHQSSLKSNLSSRFERKIQIP